MMEHGVIGGVLALALAAPAPVLAPVWTSRTAVPDKFSAIVAPDAKNVWAFGGSHGDHRGKPLAYRKSGAGWKRVALPSGLRGSIELASAASAKDIWAVGSDLAHAKPTYLLHWNGTRWSVPRRWDGRAVVSVVATGKGRVVAFDGGRARALRFDGKRWSTLKTPDSVWAAAYGGKTLWAQTLSDKGKVRIFRYAGGRWKLSDPGALLPRGGKGMTIVSGLAAAGGEVWLSAFRLADLAEPSVDGAQQILLRFRDGAWKAVTPVPKAGLGKPLPDGKGGLWFVGSPFSESADPTTVLYHRTADGRWASKTAGRVVGTDSGIDDVVRIPGTGTFLGAGSAGTKGGGYDAAVYQIKAG
ncbi:hypothetical protein [Actinocorallia lasiicapitis]